MSPRVLTTFSSGTERLRVHSWLFTNESAEQRGEIIRSPWSLLRSQQGFCYSLSAPSMQEIYGSSLPPTLSRDTKQFKVPK